MLEDTFNKHKIYIHTFGCQMNELDSEVFLGSAKKIGLIAAIGFNDADVIVLNTCSVRNRAEEKFFGKLGELKHLKNKNSDLIIAVTGCLAQQKKDEIQKKYPYVDLVIGTLNKKDFIPLLTKVIQNRKKIIKIASSQDEIYEPIDIDRTSKIKAYVAIMEGCNNFCSYCIVPFVRGREISRKKEHILDEIKKLTNNGFKEIILLGQNVNSYKDENYDFPDLLEDINRISGLERIRFMTSHPKDIKDNLIEKMVCLNKVCEHVHFPLQSGSDKILEIMNRNYTIEKYISKVEYLRKLIPDVSITTDLIVGFPGETEKDFEQTVAAYNIIRFDYAFIFHYSTRPGTKAAELVDDVPYNEKIQRLEYLLKLQEKIMTEKNAELTGKTLEVLVEGENKKNTSELTGRTRTNKIVLFDCKENLTARLVNIKITQTQPYALSGEKI